MATEEKTEQQGDGAVATADKNTLSVTDNRTGESYDLEITDGTIRGMDLRGIKVSEDDFGLMSYDPAYTNTASCRSAITYIDGEAGILQHRGYPIEQLCEKSTYLEVAYLLTFGELPDQAAAGALDVRRGPPHVRPRGPQEPLRDLPLRRPPDGDAALRGRRPLDLLPGGQAHRRPRGALHGRDPHDRQGPDARRLRLPPQPRAALRVSGQRARLRGATSSRCCSRRPRSGTRPIRA